MGRDQGCVFCATLSGLGGFSEPSPRVAGHAGQPWALELNPIRGTVACNVKRIATLQANSGSCRSNPVPCGLRPPTIHEIRETELRTRRSQAELGNAVPRSRPAGETYFRRCRLRKKTCRAASPTLSGTKKSPVDPWPFQSAWAPADFHNVRATHADVRMLPSRILV